MGNKTLVNLFLFLIVLSFQNCSKTGFTTDSLKHEDLSSLGTPSIDDVAEVVEPPVVSESRIVDNQKVSNFNQYIDEDFIFFWAFPSRAYPGIPLDFQFIVYEASNAPLTWSLVKGPSGMSITQQGILNWTPTQTQSGMHEITIEVTREDGDGFTKTFPLSVNTSDFIFVSLSGADTNTGSLNSPMRTIEAALRKINSGDGKTIYVRQGTYVEHYFWESGGVTAPTRSKSFSDVDPLVLSSYPGEKFILDPESRGHGLWLYNSRGVILKNFEVRNAGESEGGGIIIHSPRSIVQNVIVRNSNWDFPNNVTGVKVAAPDVVLDRVRAYDNKDKSSDHWNSSNYLFYTDGMPAGESPVYVLRSYSSGSVVGYKIKHAGPNLKVIFHDCVSENDYYGFGGSSNNSSIRYSTFKNNSLVNIALGLTDPTSPISNGNSNNYTAGSMLIEHNTLITNKVNNLEVWDNYAGSSIIQKNIFISQSLQESKHLSVWIYAASMASLNLSVNKNVYFNLTDISSSSIPFRYNRANETLAAWKAHNFDLNSVVANPNFLNANYEINAQSPAVFTNGEFAGSQLPIK